MDDDGGNDPQQPDAGGAQTPDPPPPPPPPPPPKPKKKLPPQKQIEAFWDKFTTKQPGKAFTILPDNLYARRAAAWQPKGEVPAQNTVASYEQAAESCKAKVEKIARECRRINQKYRDPHFDLDRDQDDCLSTINDDRPSLYPMSVKRVEDIFEKPAFCVDGMTANDVRQGNDGDCWFLSAVSVASGLEGLLQKVCVARDEVVGVYGFVFHRDGEWISEVIDDRLFLSKADFSDLDVYEQIQWKEQDRKNPEESYRNVMQRGSTALYFAQCADKNETWLPLLEKAYAKAHGDYSCIEGGWMGEGIEDLTGGVTMQVSSVDIMDKEYFWNEELKKVNKEFLFGCGTVWNYSLFRKGIAGGHAYSILDAVEVDGQRLVKVRNPWGEGEWTGPWSDGSEEWTPEWMQKLNHRFGDDGEFWMSYKDLLVTFQDFDRTRLFGPEWHIVQKWTSLNVPWTVDYLTTKFRVKINKAGPCVFVLSQLDERYFVGLEGQYTFKLQFRLHEGEDDSEYIIRSKVTGEMTRSATCEVDLEPGEYWVMMKIAAVRDKEKKTPADIIKDKCTTRRSKLLRIGLSYDLAHAKAQFKAADEEKEKEDKAKDRKKLRAAIKKAAAQLKRDKQKDKLRRKRREYKKAIKDKKAKDKARAKRAAKKQAKKEKAAAKKAAEDAEKAKADSNVQPASGEAEKKADEVPASATTETSEATQTTLPVRTKEESTEAPAADTSEGQASTTTSDSSASNKILTPATTSDGAKAEETPAADNTGSATAAPEAPEAPPAPDAPQADGDASADKDGNTADGGDDDDDSSSSSDDDSIDLSHRPNLGEISDSDASWDSDIDYPSDSTESDSDDSDSTASEAGSESEDEFAKDPWNAVCVVGLRVYSKDSEVSIEVVQPAKGDTKPKLDIDDSAVDATKGPKWTDDIEPIPRSATAPAQKEPQTQG